MDSKYIQYVETYLCNEDDNNQAKADPRASDTKNGSEWNLVQSVTMVLPCIPETNVGEANATPGEQGSQAGKRLKPVKSNGSTSIQGHESKRRP